MGGGGGIHRTGFGVLFFLWSSGGVLLFSSCFFLSFFFFIQFYRYPSLHAFKSPLQSHAPLHPIISSSLASLVCFSDIDSLFYNFHTHTRRVLGTQTRNDPPHTHSLGKAALGAGAISDIRYWADFPSLRSQTTLFS